MGAGDRPLDHDGVLLLHPGASHRGGADHQNAVARVSQSGFQAVDQHIARAEFPLIKERADARALQVLGQGADPCGVGVAVGDEHFEPAVHKPPELP